ncbi:hypothetical protein FACS189446_0580 [Bacteroidia bacterium]|nr:hypothetical protein FACS189446_0580 [Bacteroidia bacterium]
MTQCKEKPQRVIAKAKPEAIQRKNVALIITIIYTHEKNSCFLKLMAGRIADAGTGTFPDHTESVR